MPEVPGRRQAKHRSVEPGIDTTRNSPHLIGRYEIDYDAAESEVKPAIMTLARLKHHATATQAGKAKSAGRVSDG